MSDSASISIGIATPRSLRQRETSLPRGITDGIPAIQIAPEVRHPTVVVQNAIHVIPASQWENYELTIHRIVTDTPIAVGVHYD
jgi:hypothetical protein